MASVKIPQGDRGIYIIDFSVVAVRKASAFTWRHWFGIAVEEPVQQVQT